MKKIVLLLSIILLGCVQPSTHAISPALARVGTAFLSAASGAWGGLKGYKAAAAAYKVQHLMHGAAIAWLVKHGMPAEAAAASLYGATAAIPTAVIAGPLFNRQTPKSRFDRAVNKLSEHESDELLRIVRDHYDHQKRLLKSVDRWFLYADFPHLRALREMGGMHSNMNEKVRPLLRRVQLEAHTDSRLPQDCSEQCTQLIEQLDSDTEELTLAMLAIKDEPSYMDRRRAKAAQETKEAAEGAKSAAQVAAAASVFNAMNRRH